MTLPNLSSTAESLWKFKWKNAPFLVANLVLIGLISYGLMKDSELSKDEKKQLSYAEIAVSFVGSSILLLWCCLAIMLSLLYLYGARSISFIFNLLCGLLFLIILLLLSPFSITVLRAGLDAKLTDQQKNILAGLTIPSVLWSIYFTTNWFNGTFDMG